MFLPSSFHRGVRVALALWLAGTMGGCRRNADDALPVSADLPNFHWSAVAEGLEAAPLPVRKSKNGGTRFESLTIEQTGIDFGHNWTPQADYKLEIYDSLPGGGICIGDYDGDDLPDVFLTQPFVGSRLCPRSLR